MLELKVSPQAETDLTDIWVYSCEAWGIEQADNYLEQLAAGMEQLTLHPQLGLDYSHVLPSYRRLQIERHCVFYQVKNTTVVVIRVLHQEMDAPERLTE